MNTTHSWLSVATVALAVPCLLIMASTSMAAPESSAADPARSTDDAGRDTARDPGDPREYLSFSNVFTSDCMMHRAELRRIANTNPDRAIRVVLWSYTGKTRSQGSSTKILAPNAEPEALGCDGTSGLERRWEIESAEFVDPDSG